MLRQELTKVNVGNRIRRTSDTGGRGIFQRIDGHGYRVGTGQCIGNRSNFGRALAKISPFVRIGIAEAVGHGAIRTIDHAGAPWMFDTGHGLFIL